MRHTGEAPVLNCDLSVNISIFSGVNISTFSYRSGVGSRAGQNYFLKLLDFFLLAHKNAC